MAAVNGFQIATAYEPSLEQDTTDPESVVYSARSTLETAMRTALAARSGYPLTEAQAMEASLGWQKGYAKLLESVPEVVKFTMDRGTWPLLPEMCPVSSTSGGPSWFDALAACYRTLEVFQPALASTPGSKTLALVYQDAAPFSQLADRIAKSRNSPKLNIDDWNGSIFPENPNQWHEHLHNIFRKHSAVLFLGHLYRAPGEPDAWMVNDKVRIPMDHLRRYLRRPGIGSSGLPVPEVVFSGCCSGAWRSAPAVGRQELIYPKMFLEGGVRFFLGPWMDVVMPKADSERELDVLERMIGEFFERWAETPDQAVTHLYEAKRACDFHLITSLFQIYSSGNEKIIAAGAPEARQAEGALLSSLHGGDRIGEYQLISEVSSDAYSRTFWAVHPATGSNHLIQVLIDEWQRSGELETTIQAALDQLQSAGLSDSHLIPDRCEFLAAPRFPGKGLLALVCDRPPGESGADWRPAAARVFNPASPTHFDDVLRMGLKLAMLLAELHSKKIRHGNLDPRNILLLRRGGVEHFVLKDSWLQQARLGRCAGMEYAAPEELSPEETNEEMRSDCWGLGALLYEAAVGHTPSRSSPEGGSASCSLRDALGERGEKAPEGLDQTVRSCLATSPTLRPSALQIAEELTRALNSGGEFVSETESELRKMIDAGQSLFTVLGDEWADFEFLLKGLRARGHTIYLAREGSGLTLWPGGDVVKRWIPAEEVPEEERRAPGRPLTEDELGSINFASILESGFTKLRQDRWSRTPIVLVAGCDWWDRGSALNLHRIWRGLKLCQTQHSAPAILVADSFLSLEYSLEKFFWRINLPYPKPQELYQRILQFADAEHFNVPPVPEQTALSMAHQFYPCRSRELKFALRLCALRHGCIDERAIEIWDEQREQEFREQSGTVYIPSAKLPAPDAVGLPRAIDEVLRGWEQVMVSDLGGKGRGAAPRRILIEGPSGYGKSKLALTLGRRTRRPVVRVEASQCLRGGMGESEWRLRAALLRAESLQGTLVLLDDVERFFGEDQVADQVRRADPNAATMLRMSGILFDWLDSIGPLTTVVMTSTEPGKLPQQLRRRIEMRLRLDAPARLDDHTPEAQDYRGAVIRALFRNAGLFALAKDQDFLRTMARATHPGLRATPLRSAMALASADPQLARQTVQLENGSDIENWVHETILLHPSGSDPSSPDFWLSRI